MTVTAFGGIFLPFILFVLLFRRAWLLPLLCVAAVLQGPSVIDLSLGDERHGLTPFLVAASLCLLDLLRRFVQREQTSPVLRRPPPWLLAWLAFLAWSLIATLAWPWVFAGTLVQAPLGADGLDGPLTPLSWSASNVAQLTNLVVMAGVVVWALQVGSARLLPQRFLLGVLVALVISVLVGLQQRLAWNGLLPMWEGFWASNPGYHQNFRTWAGPVPRVSWPFVEASYASAWFAALLGGFVALFLAGVQRHRALLGVLVSLFALGNTLGATGFLATLVFGLVALVAVLVALAAAPRLREGLLYRLVLGTMVVGCVGLASYLVLRHYGLVEAASLAFNSLLEGRNETVLGDIRPQANWHALRVLVDSWGMGVGMGSNRASSYLATLLSNRGLIGLLLFLTAVVLQFWALARQIRREPTATAVFFFGSGVAALIAVGIAIPDQNWPVLWMLLLGGMVCLRAQDAKRQLTAGVTQPFRGVEAGERAIEPDVSQAEAGSESNQRTRIVPEQPSR